MKFNIYKCQAAQEEMGIYCSQLPSLTRYTLTDVFSMIQIRLQPFLR